MTTRRRHRPGMAEEEFLNELQKPGANQPLRVVANGRFLDKKFPLEYAYSLVTGAGLTQCQCGLWGMAEDLLTEDYRFLPCPHYEIK